ncbi:hypothetical protein [Lichenibacterium dinghuense]|uniref:hypothetical protein n=1 Tax=Lichenibacterium dinghuense TaxID=2895977 RepID=UPI001F2184B5|nr:hypothetical protein [Lichenibacterium sp. 6Y81]
MRIIHDDPPMRDEIAAGFYPRFEGGWHRAELVGRAAMLAFVAVCGLGLLGQGPLGERNAANVDRSISIRYEPVVRHGAPTTILLDTKVPPGGDKVAVTVAKELVDQFSLEHLTPQPARWEAGDDGIRLEFPIQPGAARVFLRFAGSPSFLGSSRMWARLDAGETLSWTQYAVP